MLFCDDELIGHNCNGRMGKIKLGQNKFVRVKRITFQCFVSSKPGQDGIESLWQKECVIAIDKGIRNLKLKGLSLAIMHITIFLLRNAKIIRLGKMEVKSTKFN